MTPQEKAAMKAVEHLHFELIASLWRERLARLFVPRGELRRCLLDTTAPDLRKVEGEVMRYLVRSGIDTQLDCFACSGPDEAKFEEAKWCVGKFPAFEKYFRYRVKREGVVGYVPESELTPTERAKLRDRLQAEGERAMREAEALKAWRDHAPPGSLKKRENNERMTQ